MQGPAAPRCSGWALAGAAALLVLGPDRGDLLCLLRALLWMRLPRSSVAELAHTLVLFCEWRGMAHVGDGQVHVDARLHFRRLAAALSSALDQLEAEAELPTVGAGLVARLPLTAEQLAVVNTDLDHARGQVRPWPNSTAGVVTRGAERRPAACNRAYPWHRSRCPSGDGGHGASWNRQDNNAGPLGAAAAGAARPLPRLQSGDCGGCQGQIPTKHNGEMQR